MVATWLIAGETRPYNTVGGYFKDIVPARPIFSGGPGAWEAVLRYSYTDLDSKNTHGGTFGESRRWSTGTSPEMCGSRWPMAMDILTGSISRAIPSSSRRACNFSSEGQFA